MMCGFCGTIFCGTFEKVLEKIKGSKIYYISYKLPQGVDQWWGSNIDTVEN